MDFPPLDMGEDEHGATWLREYFHPKGLSCPRCGASANRARLFRRTKRSRLNVYRCIACDRTYNLYTGTPFEGKHLRPVQVVLLLRGLTEGKSNPRLAGELGLNRTTVYYLRRELQEAGAVLPDGGIMVNKRYEDPQKPDGRRGNRQQRQEGRE